MQDIYFFNFIFPILYAMGNRFNELMNITKKSIEIILILIWFYHKNKNVLVHTFSPYIMILEEINFPNYGWSIHPIYVFVKYELSLC